MRNAKRPAESHFTVPKKRNSFSGQTRRSRTRVGLLTRAPPKPSAPTTVVLPPNWTFDGRSFRPKSGGRTLLKLRVGVHAPRCSPSQYAARTRQYQRPWALISLAVMTSAVCAVFITAASFAKDGAADTWT